MLFFFLHWFSFFLKSHCHKTESTMTSEAGKVPGPCADLCLLLLDLFCSQRLVQRRNNTSCLHLPLLIIEHDIFPMANNHMNALSERDDYVPVIETHPPFSPSSIKLLCYPTGTDSKLISPWNGLILSHTHTHTYNSPLISQESQWRHHQYHQEIYAGTEPIWRIWVVGWVQPGKMSSKCRLSKIGEGEFWKLGQKLGPHN